MDAEGRLYALFYAILYKHLQILVSSGVLESIPWKYQGKTVVKFWESQKLYVNFWLYWGWWPPPPHWQKVYKYFYSKKQKLNLLRNIFPNPVILTVWPVEYILYKNYLGDLVVMQIFNTYQRSKKIEFLGTK